MSELVFTTKAPRTHLIHDRVGFSRWLAILALILIVFWIFMMSVIQVRGNTPVTMLTGEFLMVLAMVLTLLTALSQLNIALWSRNCEITLNDKGLIYTCGPKTFRWPWQDLSPFEVRTAKPFRSWYGMPHARIAPANEGAIMRFLRSWHEPRMIVDAYDTSLEEITATLNEYRERALGNGMSGGSQSTHTGRDQP